MKKIASPIKVAMFATLAYVATACCADADGIAIDVDYSKATKLQQDVYGVNNELGTSPYTIADEGFIELVKDSGIRNFRFPAGTYSNFIDLKSRHVKGWDNINQKNVDRLNIVIDAFKNNGRGVDYADLVTVQAKTGVTTTLVLNVSSSSFEDNIAALKDIKARGCDLTYIEFGNELYYSEYETAIPSPEFYFDLALKYAPVIREIFPDVKLAIGAHASYYTRESFLDDEEEDAQLRDNRIHQWYRHAQVVQDSFEAIITHIYSTVGMDNTVKKEDFLTFEDSYLHSISHSDRKFQSTIDRLKRDFPGKEILITEYHVGGFGGEVRQYGMRRSYLGGLYTADFLLKLFSAPHVTVGSWHSFQGWFKAEGNREDGFEFEWTNANYNMFKAFKEPVHQSTQYVPITISNIKNYSGVGEHTGEFPEVDGAVFYNNDTEEGYLILINKLSSDYQISKKMIERAVGGDVVSGYQVIPDETKELLDAIRNIEGAVTEKSTVAQGGVYSVKPYSFNVYKFKR